jgi:hypothetical protein
MGKPAWGHAHAPSIEPINWREEPGELKHLSNPRNRKHSVSSGERTRNSPNHLTSGVVGRAERTRPGSRRLLERVAADGESPVGETGTGLALNLSTTVHANTVGSRGVHPPRLNTHDDR